MSYPEIKIHLIVQIAVKPFLVCLLSLLSVCDSHRESYDGAPCSKIRQIGFLFQRITPFIEGERDRAVSLPQPGIVVQSCPYHSPKLLLAVLSSLQVRLKKLWCYRHL